MDDKHIWDELPSVTPIRVQDVKTAVTVYLNTAVTDDIGAFEVEPILDALQIQMPLASDTYIYSCYARACAFTNLLSEAEVAEVRANFSMTNNSHSHPVIQIIAKLPITTIETEFGIKQEFDENSFVKMLHQLEAASAPRTIN